MMSQLSLLYHYASRRQRPRARVVCLAGLLLLTASFAFASQFVIGAPFGIDAEHVGGTPLEISFWLTALFAAFLSFFMSELYFRSPDVRLLAQLPISPVTLFFYRFGKAAFFIAAATLPTSALLFELWCARPLHAALCTGLFFFGSLLCAILSTAVLMYAGRTSIQAHGNPAATSQAFMMAPAISLFVALIADLLLKLLVEAILKPGHLDASLTAAGITGSIFVISALYATFAFRKNYYAVLSCFIDNDAVMLNANYRFIDETTLARLKSAESPQAALMLKNKAVVARKHTLSRILLISVSAILALVGFASPETLSGLNLPALAVSLCFMLAPVWLWLSDTQYDERLPVDVGVRSRARYRAALSLAAPNVLVLTAAVAVPLVTAAWFHALAIAAMTFIALVLLSAFAVFLVDRHPTRAGAYSWTVAFASAFVAIL